MYILGFETTGPIGSVAIIDLEKVSPDGYLMADDAIMMLKTDEPMSHLKNTAKLAGDLLSHVGRDSLVAVAASVGPGSFTGIRIGVTEARAIAQALNIPAIQVPTLEVFREHTFDDGQMLERRACAGSKSERPVVAAILNARRGQVYGAIYGAEGEIIKEPGPYMLTDILEVTDKYLETIFYGDGVDAYEALLSEGGSIDEADSLVCIDFGGFKRFLAPENTRYQTADLVVHIAAKKYMAGDTVSAEDLMPDYMRLAEAEQKLNDGTLQKLREAKMARMRHK